MLSGNSEPNKIGIARVIGILSTFTHWANHRRKLNGIHQIADEAGRLWSSRLEIGRAFTTYFDRLFTSQGPSRIQKCLQHMESRVTSDMNTQLLLPFVEEEVRVALN